MKKVISIILSAALIFSLIAVGVSADESATNFAVASDLHYVEPREALDGPIDDPIYWYANRRAAMEDESGYIIDEFLRQCAEDDTVEFVLVPGDIVNDGRIVVQQHIDMAAKFKAFEDETGKQIYVINGNHDNGQADIDFKYNDFIEMYYQFGYDKAIATMEGNCSYVAELNDEYRLIALDSCDPSKSTEDGMSLEKMQWVCDQAEKAYADGKYPILMMHHNLLDHLPVQRILSRNFIVRFHYTTAEMFANAGIKLVFTGHEHCSDAATYTSTLGNKIYDFATTSLTMYPIQYRYFTATDNEIKYETRTVDKIDTDALTATVSGYTQEHIDMMNAGFNNYAKGFFKAGVQYRLALGMTMEKIGIAEGEPFYNLVNTAVTGLTDILEMPLYGEEGSVQALAKEYGVDLPKTDYSTGWDLAMELAGAHYAGSENYPLDSDTISAFFKIVAIILRDDLAGIADNVLLGAVNELLGLEDGITTEITQLCTKLMGRATAVEYLLLAIASPLLYEFTMDNDGVDDNNGTLPGYGVKATAGDVVEKYSDIFSEILKYLSLFVSYILKVFAI
ncbi:MAG: metallophosphoesterase [Clostridia bacterium]|nr:metallophosphoesterase [Clostridia bacterium]